MQKLTEIERQLNSVHWYHRFELLPGVWTPGVCENRPAEYLDVMSIPADLRGKRALDIGAWDGPLSFEMERRGADVVALDIQDPSKTGFNVARSILGSRVHYVQASVYDLPTAVDGTFDLICFCGVYYHLKNPIGAFEAISGKLRVSGELIMEGEILRTYAETIDGKPVRDALVEAVGKSDIPLAIFAPGTFKDGTNWMIPNLACIRSWLSSANLELLRFGITESPAAEPYPQQRFGGVASRCAGPSAKAEHPLTPSKTV